MSLAYIGIGANLGDAQAQVRAAFDEIATLDGVRLVRRSSLYRTAPVGFLDQPDFINAVAAVETELPPHDLLAKLRGIEQRHGRVRDFRNAPRTLDLDVLLYSDLRLEDDALTLPHPRMHERAFVLAPLTEIAPDASIPGKGSVRERLIECADQQIERIEGGGSRDVD
jgi:2-amino-4-hydroxy-6-hydroxymethyldihydropteridine diphosphokinase